MGAYNQRILNQNSIPLNDVNKIEKIAAKLENIGLQELPAVLVSLSDEAKSLFAQNGIDKLKNDVEELYQKGELTRIQQNGGANEFAIKGNDQWLVFSEFLYINGFYDNMSDEAVKNTEQMLMKITDGMDNVFSWGHHIGIDLYDQLHGEQLDSNEARVELESSAAALRYFSENLLVKANKKGFDELINKYYIHNLEILNNGYASIEEKFNLGRSRLPNTIKEQLEIERLNCPESLRSEQAAHDLKIRDILGSITHSKEEINNYIIDISGLFAMMNQKNNFDDILNRVKGCFLMFVTKNSDNNELEEYVLKHSEDVFKNIDNYWSELMKITG